MSTELTTIANERGQSLADLMGISTGGSTSQASPNLSRVGMIHQPVMGEVDFNGKKIKTEILPIGTYTVKRGEEVVYAPELRVRIFLLRDQWSHWNKDTGKMEKTVLAMNLNFDLKDSTGGFNLGRPYSGYIPPEIYATLPDNIKDIVTSVNQIKVVYGLLSIDNPKDANGNDLTAEYTDIPFVFDVKNKDSRKSINSVVKKITKNNTLPISLLLNEVILSSKERSIPNGAKFGVVDAAIGNTCDMLPDDNDTMRNFLEVIEYTNGKILDLHAERCGSGLTKEDEAMVKDILDNDFVDVDE
jgi:hypothetical protein